MMTDRNSKCNCCAVGLPDTKRKSLAEALANSVGGYAISYAIGVVILPISLGWIQENLLVVNLAITGVYASVSFLRSYLIRRFFCRSHDQTLWQKKIGGVGMIRASTSLIKSNVVKICSGVRSL